MNYFDLLGKRVKFSFMRMTETEAAATACVVIAAMLLLAVL